MTVLLTVTKSNGKTRKCDARCYNAIHGDCDCICGGKYHGKGSFESAVECLIEDFNNGDQLALNSKKSKATKRLYKEIVDNKDIEYLDSKIR